MPLSSLVLLEGNREYHSDFPMELLTGTGADPRPRLRVDVAETSFWEGREFRLFHEFSIAAGALLFYKFVFNKGIVLEDASCQIDEGKARVAFLAGAVDVGPWTGITVFPANALLDTPVYVGNSTAFQGGAPTGGVERDVLRVVSASNGNSASSASAENESPRGIPPGTYHIRVQNYGAATMLGVLRLRWEEREPRSALIYG